MCRKNITLKILKYQEDGALERLKTTWWVDKGECGGSFSSTSTDSTNSLGLSSVAGIFYILISGLALAMLSAVAEYTVKSCNHKHLNRNRNNSHTLSPSDQQGPHKNSAHHVHNVSQHISTSDAKQNSLSFFLGLIFYRDKKQRVILRH